MNTTKHTPSELSPQSGQAVAKHGAKGKLAKTDSRYWLARLFRNSFTRDGVRQETANWCARIARNGRRETFNLDTPNRDAAAKRAQAIYLSVLANGWEATLAQFKPATEKPAKGATVGALIETASALSSARRHTLDAYAKALRRIVSEVKDIQDGRKFDAFKGGTKEWREKVDAVKLDSITPADVLAWKNRRLREAERDPLAKRAATVTVNSLIRNAKALLGKKVLPFVEQKLIIPRPLPFDGVGLEKGPSLRYVSKVDAHAILARAADELAATDMEAYKALVLALVCGLRRSEIDNLLWRSFDFQRRVLRVEANEYHALKSEDSAGEIDLDEHTLALFRGYRAKAPKSLFVIESPNAPQSEKKTRCYRCNAVFERVNSWLREQGVKAAKPLHTMRKEIGSIIASDQGIFEASRYLRHSDIRITSAIYADKKKTITSGLGGLLAPANVTTADFGADKSADRVKVAAPSTRRKTQ